jgi:hypothetical protein
MQAVLSRPRGMGVLWPGAKSTCCGSDGKFYRIGGKDEAKQVAHATGKRGAWLYILSGSCPAAQEGFVACLVRIAPNTTTSGIANALREPTRHTHAVQE